MAMSARRLVLLATTVALIFGASVQSIERTPVAPTAPAIHLVLGPTDPHPT
jgi:hypothetical protein